MVLSAPASAQLVCHRVRNCAKTTTADGLHQLSFQAMSTVCRVNMHGVKPEQARNFQGEVLRWVAEFEARFSRFIDDSLIGRINAAAGKHWVEIDSEAEAIFNLCQEMIFFTRGVFDPTALPLIRLWNWKVNPPVIPREAEIAAARELTGWRRVQRRPGAIFLPREGMCLDLGGIGKEYAVDRVLTMALEQGIGNVLVDFGNDVRVHGHPPECRAWHIGLEDPANPGKCWTGVAVTNHAVATSGDYLRRFVHQGRRYGHIIDPRTGYPVNNNLLSVSVIAPHCTFAGLLSTAAFILGARDGMQLLSMHPGVAGAIVTETGRFPSKDFYAYATS